MPKRPLLLGHRGTRSVASIPENTFAAFDRALDDGCDGFEFDVRLTLDGCAVICHDPCINNVTVAKAVTHQLCDLPTLEMVMERYASRAFLDIELKVAGLEDCLARALEGFRPAHGYVVSSFLPEVLHTIRKNNSDIPLGFICDREDRVGLWRELPVQYVIPHQRLVKRELIEEIHGTGKNLFVWTINGEAEMLDLARWGVDGIISDNTRQLVRILGTASL
jgi:glycerophosphoryl diester phosphodiesterase